LILDERAFDEFVPWAQRAKAFLQPFGNPPSPTTEDDWQRWGAELGLLPSLSGQTIPSPYFFDDWKSYVVALNQAVNVISFQAWSTLPALAKNGAFSVNVFTYFVLPSSGWTLTLNGSLPTGWAFASPTLSHSGAVVAGPNPISFTAKFSNGLAYTSNTFTVQGI
jgi:hypothetical protein